MLLVVRNISNKTSPVKDSPSKETVLKAKREEYNTIMFMENISKKLELPRNTWGISCVLYHRSVLNVSDLIERGDVDRAILATACVFLASKVDDNPRDLKAFTRLFLKHPAYGRIYENKEKEIRDEIIDTEYLILQNTGFEFDFDLPYTYLNNAKSVFKHKDSTIIFKKAETFLNECFRSDLCLYYPPQVLAAASLYMSSRFLRIDLNNLVLKEKSFNGVLTESTDVSCYEKQEVGELKEEVFVQETREFGLGGLEGAMEEGSRPKMSLTLKMANEEEKESREEEKPSGISLVFNLKKKDEEEEEHVAFSGFDFGFDKQDDLLLGKRSSPFESSEVKKFEELERSERQNRTEIRKVNLKEKICVDNDKLKGGFFESAAKELHKENKEIKIVKNAIQPPPIIKRIKSLMVSKSTEKKKSERILGLESNGIDLQFDELQKNPLRRASSEKRESSSSYRLVENETENGQESQLYFWWQAFGEEVDLLTILNISEAIFSQLKMCKE